MPDEVKNSGMRRRGTWTAFAILTVLIVALANHRFEPFARRVEDRTLRAWLGVFAEEARIDDRIVEAFQTNITPHLIAVIERGRREGFLRGIFGEVIGIQSGVPPERQKIMLAAGTWLSALHVQGYEVRC